jgi:hypothetical protein
MKKYFALLLLLIITACTRGEALTGTLAVYHGEEAVLAETTVTFRDGDSVLDILRKATRDTRIHMDYTGAGITAYVKGIANIYEFDEGPESGWTYRVNGELVMQSAGSYKPAGGDAILWVYVTEP